MKKLNKIVALGALAAGLAWGQATTNPGTFRGPEFTPGTYPALSFTAGVVNNGGHSVSVAAGSVNVTGNKTDCSAPGFANCNFVYANSSGTVANTTTLATAAASGNTLLALVETNAGSTAITSVVYPLQSGTLGLAATGALPLNAQGNGVIPPATKTFTAFSTWAAPGAVTASVSDVNGQIWFSQLFIPANVTLTGACILNGSAPATDSAILGLYSAAGVLLANTALAGTLQATASIFQCIAFTGTVAVTGPASYFVAFQGNGTHATQLVTYSATGAPTGYITGSQAGTFGTLASISPGTSFTSAVGPVMSVY